MTGGLSLFYFVSYWQMPNFIQPTGVAIGLAVAYGD